MPLWPTIPVVSWLTDSWLAVDHEPAVCPFVAKKDNETLGCIAKSVANGLREAILPLCTALWGHSWNIVSSYGFPSSRKKENCLSRGPQRWLGAWSISVMRKSWETCACSAWRRLGGDLFTVYKYVECSSQGKSIAGKLWTNPEQRLLTQYAVLIVHTRQAGAVQCCTVGGCILCSSDVAHLYLWKSVGRWWRQLQMLSCPCAQC